MQEPSAFLVIWPSTPLLGEGMFRCDVLWHYMSMIRSEDLHVVDVAFVLLNITRQVPSGVMVLCHQSVSAHG